ncbi:MAG: hypothetical protein AAF497_09460 [Planctomycetota bacterium]
MTEFVSRTAVGLGSSRQRRLITFLLFATISAVGCQKSDVSPQPVATATGSSDSLQSRCERAAYLLEGQLGDEFSIVVRSPFLVAGDSGRNNLVEQIDNRIIPTRRALTATYSISDPTNPITIILCDSESSYLSVSRRVFDLDNPSSLGYYRPTERTMVINEASGQDAMSHELTHALFAQDWPNMPLWLNEGLASLHESCEFTDEKPWLRPKDNWRLPIAKESIRNDPAGIIRTVIEETDFGNDSDGSKYARVRYFAWYLHERGVLGPLILGLKKASVQNVRQLATDEQIERLCAAFDQPLEEIEREFKQWLARRTG